MAGAKPYGLRSESSARFGKPEHSREMFHRGQTSEGNQTPGNADSGKRFSKSNPLVNPAHKGYCTPMSKSTCTPRRKAFAERVKREHGFH